MFCNSMYSDSSSYRNKFTRYCILVVHNSYTITILKFLSNTTIVTKKTFRLISKLYLLKINYILPLIIVTKIYLSLRSLLQMKTHKPCSFPSSLRHYVYSKAIFKAHLYKPIIISCLVFRLEHRSPPFGVFELFFPPPPFASLSGPPERTNNNDQQ